MNTSFLRNIAKYFLYTPIHPQWIANKQRNNCLNIIKSQIKGTILDIGCSDKFLKKVLDNNCNYIGLDYLQTAKTMYNTTPDIYGDAHNLPIKNSSIDSITLLDVLEHLGSPEECIIEIQRVLKPGGKFCLQAPFLYPIHDAPYDFQRWTKFGLLKLLESNNFKIEDIYENGSIPTTLILLVNLGISKITSELIEYSRFFLLLLLITMPLILFFNIVGLTLGLLFKNTSFMPFGYLIICQKNNGSI